MAVLSARLIDVAADEHACSLCDGSADATPAPPTAEHRDDLIAWVGVLAAGVLLASLGDGALRWIGVGAVIAVSLAAVCAVQSVRTARRGLRAAHARDLQALAEDADGRVATVIRQFEWAVNDVVHLKRQVERGEAAVDALLDRANERERRIRALEQDLAQAREEIATFATATGEPGPFAPAAEGASVPHFRWAVHRDGHRANMELECVASSHRPARVRIVDQSGDIVMTSGTPMRTEDGAALFSLSKPPAELLDALEAGIETTYAFQAFVDYEWRQITVEDSGRRTKVVMDKQGRSYRVTDTERMLELRDGRRRRRRHEPPATFAQLN